MSYIKRTWVVENEWVCDSCEAKNLGRNLMCGGCGSPKEKQEKDKLASPDAPAVTDPELLKKAAAGPNWVCDYCGGQNRGPNGECVNCAASKPPTFEEAATKFAEAAVRGETRPGIDPTFGGWPKAAQPAKLPVPGPGVPARPPPTSTPSWGAVRRDGGGWHPLYAIFAVAPVAGFVGLLLWVFVPREAQATVTLTRWARVAELKQRTTMHGEGWGSPFGAFNESCQRRYYGQESCNPHNCRPHSVSYECNCTSYECNCHKSCRDNGNGFSTCSESCSTCQRCSTCSRTEYDTCYDSCPVYKQWCSYDYYEWPTVKQLQTGSDTHDEHWPDLAAEGPEQKLVRRETYLVTFTGADGSWNLSPDFAEFQRFETGARWLVKVNRLGSVTPLQELK